MDMGKKQAQYERARKDKEEKERCVDKAVLSKAEKMEKDFGDLSERRATVLKDREQIKLVQHSAPVVLPFHRGDVTPQSSVCNP
jgi:hypothetical protein